VTIQVEVAFADNGCLFGAFRGGSVLITTKPPALPDAGKLRIEPTH